MTLLVVLCLLAMGYAPQLVEAAGGSGVTMEYESKLFDTSEVLEINILIDEADWQNMLDNAINEEYVACDVEIAGETFCQVGIRPKGNTSLSAVYADPDTERYSFKLEFDQYVEGQTCFGLDKLILNNNYADATNMKEALVYDLYAAMNVDASLYNYAKVSVNGEYWGVYLALEAVEDSFLLRNYGTESGELYKPDSMEMGGGGGGGMFGGSGANLNYTDDELDSYTSIWDSSVTDTGDGDHERVITALKNIAEGNDLERYMDVGNLLKYAAVHIFSVNSDSLSGSMAHNYYLYESDGQLNLLPWDYNLAFGGMGGMGGRGGTDTATDTVNSPIDDAWNATEFFDTLMADEGYHDIYYACMEQVVDYVLNGGFEAFYDRTRSLIDTLVETDPTTFYPYEEYLTAVETLYEVVTLRGQSIQGQLDGTIPSTQQEQQNSDGLIDASHIDLSVMGSMNMGGGGGGNLNFGDMAFGNFTPSQGSQGAEAAPGSGRADDMSADPAGSTQSVRRTAAVELDTEGSESVSEHNSSSQTEEDGSGYSDPSQFDGELPEGFDPSQFSRQMPGGFGQSAPAEDNDAQGGEQESGADASEDGQAVQGQQPPDMGNMPGRGGLVGTDSGQTGIASGTVLLYYGVAAGMVIAAFLFAMFYRRRPRKR